MVDVEKLTINGHDANVTYDTETKMFRGEFVGLNGGGADFYSYTIEDLREEGELSLKVFLDMCQEQNIKPV